ncbi:MAG: TPM domain-containing protein [Candidatus Limiplasma sp.]|nr:TPM domain-containing protein [Candidatus Limiplasma sp.]MEA5144484.1 TPM domain-containing protein [Candidatus Limiplasma sp.]
MMRKQRILALLLAALLTLAAGTAMAAAATGRRVYDNADLFTPVQEEALANAIADFQSATGMDFVVLTSNQAHGDSSQQTIADAFYDKGGFGLDAENSGALYYIDMYDRQEYISTTGQMIDYLTDERIEQALDVSNPNLRAAHYADAALAMLQKVQSFVKAGIPEGQYRYDVLTGQVLTARHKVLTTTEMLVGGGICVLFMLIFMGAVKSRYKLKGSTYQYDYATNAQVDMTESHDDYLRTTVTRTRKAPPPSSGGGGFGGGGGSGVHSGGGGVSHGGGGRGF